MRGGQQPVRGQGWWGAVSALHLVALGAILLGALTSVGTIVLIALMLLAVVVPSLVS